MANLGQTAHFRQSAPEMHVCPRFATRYAEHCEYRHRPARRVRHLLKVESGGYASDLLMTHCASLDARDAGLAAEIVFGVLRYRRSTRFPDPAPFRPCAQARSRGAHRPAHGVYQLRYLERVPPHAAVKDSVELVKRAIRPQPQVSSTRCCARQSRSGRVAQPRNRALLSGVAAGQVGSGIRAETAVAIAQAALREPGEIRPHSPPATACRISDRSPSCPARPRAWPTLPRPLRRAGE